MAETDNPYNLPPDCLVCKYRKDLWCSAMKILLSVAVVFVCIGGVKTAISFILYGIAGGQAVVIPDLIAAAADSIMLVVGILLSGTVVKVVRRAEK